MFKRQKARPNRYSSSIHLIASDYDIVKNHVEESLNDKTVKLSQMKTLVYDLSVSKEEWLGNMKILLALDVDTCQECISDFCSSYLECNVESLKNACEWIALDNTFDFLSRFKCIDTLQQPKTTYTVLKQYMQNPTDDINFTMYSDYLYKLYSEKWMNNLDIEKMTNFVFSAKFVSWSTKYNLWKHLCSSAVANSVKQTCGKTLLNLNTLSSYTVLALQLYTFDTLTLQTILKRCKAHSDVKVKADVLDHLLQYQATSKEANKLLKDLGDGMKTLDSSQNAHMVTGDIDNWLQSLATVNLSMISLEDVFKDLQARWDDSEITSSLRRIELDNTLYGKMYLKLAGVLHRVYIKITNHKDFEQLFLRLKEELIEMSDTCSTGHLLRLMNVFTGYEKENFIKLDPTVELKSVLNKRIEMWLESLQGVYDDDFVKIEGRQTLTLKAKDEEEKRPIRDETSVYDKILDAWTEGNEAILQKYVYAKLPEIKDELFVQYVGQKLMSESDFEEAYRNVTSSYFVGGN